MDYNDKEIINEKLGKISNFEGDMKDISDNVYETGWQKSYLQF